MEIGQTKDNLGRNNVPGPERPVHTRQPAGRSPKNCGHLTQSRSARLSRSGPRGAATLGMEPVAGISPTGGVNFPRADCAAAHGPADRVVKQLQAG
jgi:hypothetical protein